MNKKEINEIKRTFSDDCGLFTVNHVVTAFVDAEKNIKCKTNQLYNTIDNYHKGDVSTAIGKVIFGVADTAVDVNGIGIKMGGVAND